VKFNYQSITVA